MLKQLVTDLPTVSLSPHQSKLYYLRMLLHNKNGAQSYQDLRTIDGHIFPTFQDACQCMGLLEDDSNRDAAVTVAASIRFGFHICDLFANILIHCKPTNSLEFYEIRKIELCSQARQQRPFTIRYFLICKKELHMMDWILTRIFNSPPPHHLDLARAAAQLRVL